MNNSKHVAVALALALVAVPTAAQTAPAPASCQTPASAVAVVANVSRGLGRVPRPVMVATAPLESDIEATRGDELSMLVARLVAGRLGANAKPATRVALAKKPLSLAEARKAARAQRALVYLQPRIAAGRLHVTADGYPMPRSVFARARIRTTQPVAHAHAHAPIDAEVRLYLKPISFAPPVVSKFVGADPSVLAVACGDLDADGSPDVVTVTRQRILRVALRAGKVERLRAKAWSTLAPVAPVPLRQPLAFATIVPPNASASGRSYLDVSLSDRAGSVRLGSDLRLVAKLATLAVPAARATACTELSNLVLGTARGKCTTNDLGVAAVKRSADALAAAAFANRRGLMQTFTLLRHKRMAYLDAPGGEVALGVAGAQLAVGDLDQDGQPDVATTRDGLVAKYDHLRVRTLLASGTLEPRFSLPVPTGVEALAFCPPDGPGRAAIVLVSKQQVWVIR